MKVRAIITGVTGMVGEGVLHECLQHPDVEVILVVNRKPCGVTHPKLKEIIHTNFFDLSGIEPDLKGYNACFFCLGVSSIGMKEEEYNKLTYILTMHVAETLVRQNSDMTFCYVSGSGTDSTEHGKSMWARVKGKTENSLMRLPFRQAYMFRPAFMKATKGAKNVHKLYYLFAWMYPILKATMPQFVCTLNEVGRAMVNSVTKGYPKKVLEVKDIVALSEM